MCARRSDRASSALPGQDHRGPEYGFLATAMAECAKLVMTGPSGNCRWSPGPDTVSAEGPDGQGDRVSRAPV